MNFYRMRREFDLITRGIGETDFDEFRDQWLNEAWKYISTLRVIPQLHRSVTWDSVADQASYDLPYDYNGAEMFLYHDSKRLDPVPEDALGLMYEQRTGNMGGVWYYSLSNAAGSDSDSVADAAATNGSTTVTSAGAAAGHVGQWLRFDPVTAAGVTTDPGEYGYLISSVTAGVSFTLDRTYRGAALTNATARIRPAETPTIVVYGNPSSAVTDAFEFKYSAVPRRLYNDADVPEFPVMGMAIVQMAVSLAMDYNMMNDGARTWFGRAMARVDRLFARRNNPQTLITDLTIGSISGRQTGPRSLYSNRHSYIR